MALSISRSDEGGVDPVTGDPLTPEGHTGTAARWSTRGPLVDSCPSCQLGQGPQHHKSPRCQTSAPAHCDCGRCF